MVIANTKSTNISNWSILMKIFKCLFLIVFCFTLVYVFTSCDENESETIDNLVNILVTHDIEDGLDKDITTKRFSGFDRDGEIVYGPFEEERSENINLVGVPAETVFILKEYINGQGEVISGTLVPVNIKPGNNLEINMLDDPTAPVHYAKTDEGFALMVVQDSSPGNLLKITEQNNIASSVFIKGVGFDYNLTSDFDSSTEKWFSYVDPDIKNISANSIRTYGVGWNFADATQQADLIGKMLKFASDKSTASNKITVLAGLVYDSSQSGIKTLITDTVKKVQMDPNFDHLLKWVIGNEVDSSEFSDLNDVIKAVQETAKNKPKLKRPVGTALPTVSEGFVTTIQTDLPDINWLGINTFYGEYNSTHIFTGFLDKQADNLSTGGWTKPWAITEYYSYDLPAAPFGSFAGMPNQTLNGEMYFLELNSTLNADNYTRSYNDYIASSDAKMKGSTGGYVLNWGPPHNSKLVAFWKEVYTYDGQFQAFVNPTWTGGQSFNRLNAYDAVYELYKGSPNPNPAPQIVLPTSMDRQGIGCPQSPAGTCPFWATLDTDPSIVSTGQSLTAQITAKSSANELTFNWYLVGGTSTGGNGFSGDILAAQNNPQDFVSTTTGGNQCPTNNTTVCGSGGSPMNGQLNVCSGGSNAGEDCQTNSDCSGGGTCAINTTNSSSTWTSTLNFIAPDPASSGNNYQLRVIILDGQGGAATAAVGFPM